LQEILEKTLMTQRGTMKKTAIISGALLAATLLTPAVRAKGISEPSPELLGLALSAVECAAEKGVKPKVPRLTIIDYSRPSTERRLWVLDLESREWLFHELVAHGQKTGDNEARHFSNRLNSHQSSLGLFLTDAIYTGKHGRSMRLRGLEPGFNDKALQRAIVMHGAAYVSESFIRQVGRLGRSWGCPAVPKAVNAALIKAIHGGSFLFAYYPDEAWLASSPILQDCDAAAQVPELVRVRAKVSQPAKAKKAKRST
jgi:hypothetical protein